MCVRVFCFVLGLTEISFLLISFHAFTELGSKRFKTFFHRFMPVSMVFILKSCVKS